MSAAGQRGQIGQRQGRPPVNHGTIAHLPPPHRSDLEVDQFGYGQALTAQAGPYVVAVRAVVSERDGQDASTAITVGAQRRHCGRQRH